MPIEAQADAAGNGGPIFAATRVSPVGWQPSQKHNAGRDDHENTKR
jgi:hypothetical protein